MVSEQIPTLHLVGSAETPPMVVLLSTSSSGTAQGYLEETVTTFNRRRPRPDRP